MRSAPVTNRSEIVRRRMNLGLDQASLARLAAITPAYLSQIEAGVRQGAPGTLKRIADGLGCEVDDITQSEVAAS